MAKEKAPAEEPAVKMLAPKAWALQKVDAIAEKHGVARTAVKHLLAGAYQHAKWERDHAGSDMNVVSEDAFDAAIDAVATLSISNPNPKG